jgi:hypothetical protein
MSRPHPFEPAPRHELDVHPAVVDYLASVGETLMDSSTPRGFARLKAKYADRTGG